MEQIENSADKSSEFIKLRTQKEAVLKMYGTGITDDDIKTCLKNKGVPSQKIEDSLLSVGTGEN